MNTTPLDLTDYSRLEFRALVDWGGQYALVYTGEDETAAWNALLDFKDSHPGTETRMEFRESDDQPWQPW